MEVACRLTAGGCFQDGDGIRWSSSLLLKQCRSPNTLMRKPPAHCKTIVNSAKALNEADQPLRFCIEPTAKGEETVSSFYSL